VASGQGVATHRTTGLTLKFPREPRKVPAPQPRLVNNPG
jgi:hypothetical protein